MNELVAIIEAIAKVFYEGGLYILIGLVLAGCLHEFVPMRVITRLLGKESATSALKAAVLGMPIPLCSCSVLPTAAALKAQGASRPALTSFLISTPETGVDSIALTYGLMGPVMAVLRPIAAIFSGLTAGIAVLFIRSDQEMPDNEKVENDCCQAASSEVTGASCHVESRNASRDRLTGRMQDAMSYAFGPLLNDIAFWMALGLVLTGIISAFIPPAFFSEYALLAEGLVPMLIMLVIGVPLYLCASASTPIAAALVVAGLSPGAALVFLLTGPATNMATMAVVLRLLGLRVLGVYITSIVLVALGFGLLTDWLFADLIRSATLSADMHNDTAFMQILKIGGGLIFAGLLIWSLLRGALNTGIHDLKNQALGLKNPFA